MTKLRPVYGVGVDPAACALLEFIRKSSIDEASLLAWEKPFLSFYITSLPTKACMPADSSREVRPSGEAVSLFEGGLAAAS
jgi:hypothetical protein